MAPFLLLFLLARAADLDDAQAATVQILHAQQSGLPADYAAAAAGFARALAADPTSADADTWRWYRGIALYGAEDWAAAVAQFDTIVADPATAYVDGARFQRMKAREQILVQKYGRVVDLPTDAVEERADTTPFGKTIHRYRLSPEHAAFIAACDDVATHPATDPLWAPIYERDRVALLYLPGQILLTHGRFDEARPRLEAVIAGYPDRDEAQYAAGLLVNMADAEGDRGLVAELTDRYMHLGAWSHCCLGCEPEPAEFNLAYNLLQTDRAAAAAAFLAFVDRYPYSDHAKEALWNAANSYDILGRATDAIPLFQRLVATYPTDAFAPRALFRLGDAYAALQDHDRAIASYERAAATSPTDVDSPAALWNAAYLRAATGDARGAACDFERYATTWPDQPDAEDAYWAAGAQWAKAKPRRLGEPRCPAEAPLPQPL